MAKVRIRESELRKMINECVTNIIKEEDGNSDFSKKFFKYAKDAKEKKVPNKSVKDYIKDEYDDEGKVSEQLINKIVKESVRRALNELDWRTAQSAFEKAKTPEQALLFRQYANNAFNRQNGYGLKNVPDSYLDDKDLTADGDYYGGRNTFGSYEDSFYTKSGNNHNGKIYHQQEIVTDPFGDYDEIGNFERGQDITDTNDPNDSSTFNPRLKMAQMKGDKQVRDYLNGKTKYVKGKGWK